MKLMASGGFAVGTVNQNFNLVTQRNVKHSLKAEQNNFTTIKSQFQLSYKGTFDSFLEVLLSSHTHPGLLSAETDRAASEL